ncbi:valine--tRNA ligase [Rikenella microfusus]|uniref:Valine--tRNA ligase n=1 Tax=Rikenella microfusus TaxID=28139 RepID=A0A379MWD8_9BACT|nr:valine--tRNA ligase [Rikenella microfusus]SUE34952.1 Valine--tRNA ligase [Rikenella microfusus]HJE88243.1 valine--tRNA ligase [Rikenella microfusus]
MTEIPAKYDPAEKEDKWYQYWLDNGFFHSEPDGREPYTIVIPPPNVTGVLHMGHMLNNTIQDVLVRRARMQGKNACWVPGTDHASIATEAKVVQKLAAEGIKKSDLTREEFLRHAWEWKEKHGGIILEQLKKLGASCDWARTKFTMDQRLSDAVIHVFVDLYNKGKIYRGVRMVNWDPAALTAISDEEVIYKEEHGKLYYLRYMVENPAEGEPAYAVVATTRPETIMGDTAMCINPDDPKNTWLKGKRVIVPLVGRSIPVIEDSYVDIEFGTGCLKVTPAHDVNDYMLGQKHNLPSIDIFNDNGTLSQAAGLYVGMDRFEVRRRIETDLREAGLMEKVEDYTNKVGTSERSGAVIEPKLSMQWFLKMDEMAKPALEAVMEDVIRLVPAKFKNTYRYWMENVKDWCVSRQLWWGQQIPAYYIPQSLGGGYVVAETIAEAVELARAKTGHDGLTEADLTRDPDVLDTWFSSWLWPMSVFDGVLDPDNAEINYYYPTNDLVTAPEILFFWVARMIMAGYEYRGERPFGNVYLTGIVRDKLRRKMSKSLGNSPDPLDLIAKYGADSVRVAMMLCSSAGNDIIWDESLIEQGRNFGNKIWNSFRLIKMWEVSGEAAQPESAKMAVEWFGAKLAATVAEIDDHFASFRISDALMTLYRLFWEDFSGWYLEMVKPAYGQPLDAATYGATIAYFERLLQQLHPYMPFITEEIWHYVAERGPKDSIMVSRYAPVTAGKRETTMVERFEWVKEVVGGIRNVRKTKNIAQKEPLELLYAADENYPAEYESVIVKMGNLSAATPLAAGAQKPSGAASFIVKTTEYFIPLGSMIDADAERERIAKELNYTRGFLASVMKKLSNERFVQNAPAQVIANERAKQADAEAKIRALEEQLAALE